MESRFIFITGGVVSSLGKGVASAALAALLQSAGYKVRLKKLDPYLNIDPGTMSPYQHGEVFVTEDGAETDLDLGHYERFTGVNSKKSDNVTAGKIYSDLLSKERKGEYLGVTVQVIPHVTDLIKAFIFDGNKDADFVLCEIGGTVGDIEAQPFLEAIRQIQYELGSDRVLFLHLTLLPYISTTKELKTKPTQHSVKELRSIGIQPDILLCRSEKPISEDGKQKIALFCNVKPERVILGCDQKTIYHALLAYHQEGLAMQVLKFFKLSLNANSFNISKWESIVNNIDNPEKSVEIAIVGKYTKLKDSYKSLTEAIFHAGIFHKCKVKIRWLNAGSLNEENIDEKMSGISAILVPGGFGSRDIEGKMLAIKYARINNIPFLGICLGMQLAAIEFARNVLKISNAGSSEFDPDCTKIISLITEWQQDGKLVASQSKKQLGGTMRLGAFPCFLKDGTLAQKVYNSLKTSERHRHRWEFNTQFKDDFADKGMIISGASEDGMLTEIIEYSNHPWFIGVQFHPELKSRAFEPHPLFTSFVNSAIIYGSRQEV